MGANYTTIVGSTETIAGDIESFNDSSVASIDDFSCASYGGNRVTVVVEYTPT